MGHLNAKPVDAREEALRLFHAVLEPLAANQLDGFHQRASGVTQQNPIDRIMNVGAQAGGVEKGALQIHRLGQGQPLGGGGARAQELLKHCSPVT